MHFFDFCFFETLGPRVFIFANRVRLSKHNFGLNFSLRSFLRICSHLLKKSLMENFSFCAVFTSFNIHKKYSSHTSHFTRPVALFKCSDKHCKNCLLYVNPVDTRRRFNVYTTSIRRR